MSMTRSQARRSQMPILAVHARQEDLRRAQAALDAGRHEEFRQKMEAAGADPVEFLELERQVALASEDRARLLALDAALEALRLTAALHWFSGKGLEKAREAIETLRAAEALGHWPPKAARSVRAALNKQAVAEKFARAQEQPSDGGYRREVPPPGERRLGDIESARVPGKLMAPIRGWNVVHAMRFGTFESAPEVAQTVRGLESLVSGPVEEHNLAVARRWARDMRPLADLVERLDGSRPRPSYVVGQLTEAVLDNLRRVVGVDFATASVPPIDWREIEVPGPGNDGAIERRWVGEVRWLPGTRHGASRYARDGEHCEACGHAIRNARNWVPIQLDGARGPASLWVGRDCAEHLLGARVAGEGELIRDPAAASARAFR